MGVQTKPVYLVYTSVRLQKTSSCRPVSDQKNQCEPKLVQPPDAQGLREIELDRSTSYALGPRERARQIYEICTRSKGREFGRSKSYVPGLLTGWNMELAIFFSFSLAHLFKVFLSCLARTKYEKNRIIVTQPRQPSETVLTSSDLMSTAEDEHLNTPDVSSRDGQHRSLVLPARP